MNSSTLTLVTLGIVTSLALAGCGREAESPDAVDGAADITAENAAGNAAPNTVGNTAGGAAGDTLGNAVGNTTDTAAATLAGDTDADAAVPDVAGPSADLSDGPQVAASLPDDTLGDEATLDALVGESEIPYPVYPNGEKYRVGGENGLKIVLFETTDSFDAVDAYYGSQATQTGMPRLAGMEDYVRYSRVASDDDPWATNRPGIVIHRFVDDEAREAVGADASARTNIIMSF